MSAADGAGASSVVMGTAQGLEVLVFGRALYGLGIGFAMHAAPAYIAEAAPANVRGTLIRREQRPHTLILPCILCAGLSCSHSGWRSYRWLLRLHCMCQQALTWRCVLQLEGGAGGVRHPAGLPGILPVRRHGGRLAHHVQRLRCACAHPPGGHGGYTFAVGLAGTSIPEASFD